MTRARTSCGGKFMSLHKVPPVEVVPGPCSLVALFNILKKRVGGYDMETGENEGVKPSATPPRNGFLVSVIVLNNIDQLLQGRIHDSLVAFPVFSALRISFASPSFLAHLADHYLLTLVADHYSLTTSASSCSPFCRETPKRVDGSIFTYSAAFVLACCAASVARAAKTFIPAANCEDFHPTSNAEIHQRNQKHQVLPSSLTSN
ncbi:hypothetical protein Cgig2_011581 [Carnegiea gigantea]|uniref:Uncharacterized protein n=1 Tax=Carnegiea gigantea TaxID=171969 RepID=A0A9Q1K871_9CARY|nr:hypothetical protein Cgig2_011581 [Carnegiea gigantea]